MRSWYTRPRKRSCTDRVDQSADPADCGAFPSSSGNHGTGTFFLTFTVGDWLKGYVELLH